MTRRLLLPLIAVCAALVAPGASYAASDLHVHGAEPAAEPTAKEALRLARELHSGEGVDTGRELSVALRTLAEKLPELKGDDRRKAERLLARPTQGQATDSDAKAYTVPEAPAHCGPHFCVHYVTSTENAPPLTDDNGNGVPDYVEATLREFENVWNVENDRMGWAPPRSDGAAGGDARTDVYLANIGPEGLYGYAAADPNQTSRQQWFAYLVMDNDYSERTFTSRYSNFLDPLKVTAAHEYNHVLQYGYDGLQDSWMFEATATWMEDKVYDDINDYRGYLGEWARRSIQPLTQFNPPESGDSNAKVYGSAVFNRWIDTKYGQDVIRRAWEVSIETQDFAPAAYEKALNERGTSFFDVFTRFAADTAEWRAANTPFEEGETFPDVARALDRPLVPQTRTGNRNNFAAGNLDHTGYALIPVDPAGEGTVTVGATLPRGVAGAIALVGRTGDETGGNATTNVVPLPNGGAGRVSLDNAPGFARVTAVVVNSDIEVNGFNRNTRDWNWLADSAPLTVAVNDFTRPTVRKITPRNRATRVKRNTKIKIQFNEGMAGFTASSIKLIGPGGRAVAIAPSITGDGRVLKIAPLRGLARGRRYTVKLSAGVTDAGGNQLPASKRTFRFSTAR